MTLVVRWPGSPLWWSLVEGDSWLSTPGELEDLAGWDALERVPPWEDGRWRRCPVEGCAWDTRGTAAGAGESVCSPGTAAGAGESVCSPGTGDGSITDTPGCLIGAPLDEGGLP